MLLVPDPAKPRGFPVPALGQLRVRRAWSQEMLAEYSGVARPTIARLEAGHTARFRTIHKLADALGVTPAELMKEAE